MKTRNFILIAVTLMAMPSGALAQKQIKDMFQKISNYSGVKRIGQENSTMVDTAGVTTECKVSVIEIGPGYFGDCDLLRKAFESESSHASMFYSYIVDHFADGGNGEQRKQWAVTREGQLPVIVGSMKNSTYFIANFDDAEHPGYRACYAAEWSEADDPDPRQLHLTYVYGRKPESHKSISNIITYSARADWPELEQRMGELSIIPDSLFKGRFEELDKYFPDRRPQDIPMKNGNTQEWMQQAIARVKHLSASDWHRFFGIMTQNMIDRAKRESKEDMVVAANLVLDLCKHADQLDDDERAVAARRLQQMNNSEIIADAYVRDLLQLGYKKLTKK